MVEYLTLLKGEPHEKVYSLQTFVVVPVLRIWDDLSRIPNPNIFHKHFSFRIPDPT
jgi:hypothetical protein